DISRVMFSGRASDADQEAWFRENGPVVPALLDELRAHGREYDRLLFWSYRYFPTYFGLPDVADRAILLPTAEEDPLIRAAALARLFGLPAGFLFLTPEEEALVAERGPIRVPSAVIGCGINPVKTSPDPVFRAGGKTSPFDGIGPKNGDKTSPDPVSGPYILYLGRVDPNKGCDALIRHFMRYVAGGRPITLVLAGPLNMPVP